MLEANKNWTKNIYVALYLLKYSTVIYGLVINEFQLHSCTGVRTCTRHVTEKFRMLLVFDLNSSKYMCLCKIKSKTG
jgi:hypothetical protein